MAQRSRLGFYASLLLITGCFGGNGGGCEIFDANGLAGNGSFRYECVGDGVDPECDDRAFALGGQLPARPIARTARFRLTYVDDPTATVKAASPKAASGTGTFVAERAGTIGFFVEARNSTSDIEEAVRLRVADPDLVRISRADDAVLGDDPLVIGHDRRFRVTASNRGQALIGALTGTWSVEPEGGLAEIETDDSGAVTLRGLAAGKVRLRVVFEGLTDSIVVDVFDSTPGGDGGMDASTDGGTDASQD